MVHVNAVPQYAMCLITGVTTLYTAIYRRILTTAGSGNDVPILKVSNTTNRSAVSTAVRPTITEFDGKPLLFLYDCETTGFSYYGSDRIIEIASTILVPDNVPDITDSEFSSLCYTSRQSNPKGE